MTCYPSTRGKELCCPGGLHVPGSCCWSAREESRTRAPKARRGIPQHREKNCAARGDFSSQDPAVGVRGRSPERERLKRDAVSRNAGKRTVLLGGLLVPGSCCWSVRVEPRTRAPTARCSILQRREKNCAARGDFSSQDPAVGV
ncbi:hypothetical protein NDU88_005228 [Pleurodeles waltl]|uniref:Uncharacterized protein n=1 Tax=Pleurodeles waltl TaxID=8319 RepID=A0AAV7LKI7_PLEWA|nr:hypothetical protein NDU88_005228 [Pleurodeles waltl]